MLRKSNSLKAASEVLLQTDVLKVLFLHTEKQQAEHHDKACNQHYEKRMRQ